tara:strand:+ start:25248 stop:25517 length:270 start_codon:yes stop_codon:yes gene_type:complete
MKIPLHQATHLYEDEVAFQEEILAFQDTLLHENTVYDMWGVAYHAPLTCTYNLENTPHNVLGECLHCDYERVREKERLAKKDWLDITEY